MVWKKKQIYPNSVNFECFEYGIRTDFVDVSESIQNGGDDSVELLISFQSPTPADSATLNLDDVTIKINSNKELDSCLLTWVEPYWDSSWGYKQPVYISVDSGETEEDYQLRIDLNTEIVGPNFNWDNACSDLRFIGSEGTELDYWIEACNQTDQNAIVWIKVPVSISETEKRIDVYYGKEDVSSNSSGPNTFIIFDDFEDTSYNSGDYDWNFFSCSTGNAVEENGYLRLTNGSVYLSRPILYSNSVIETQNIRLDFKAMTENNYGESGCIGVGFNWNKVAGGTYCGHEDMYVFLDWPNVGVYLYEVDGYSSNIIDSSSSADDHQWHDYYVFLVDDYFEAKRDDISALSGTINSSLPNGYFVLYGREISDYTRFDEVRLRKYHLPEPTASFDEEKSDGVIEKEMQITNDGENTYAEVSIENLFDGEHVFNVSCSTAQESDSENSRTIMINSTQ
jgi:hypothetical protein